MELISGIFLGLLDVIGIKTVQKENIASKKVFKVIGFSLMGFVCLVGYFIIFS
jgi:hypothetical protein